MGAHVAGLVDLGLSPADDEVVEDAPDIASADEPDETGKKVGLADLAGRRAVLFFFPKAGTSG